MLLMHSSVIIQFIVCILWDQRTIFSKLIERKFSVNYDDVMLRTTFQLEDCSYRSIFPSFICDVNKIFKSEKDYFYCLLSICMETVPNDLQFAIGNQLVRKPEIGPKNAHFFFMSSYTLTFWNRCLLFLLACPNICNWHNEM